MKSQRQVSQTLPSTIGTSFLSSRTEPTAGIGGPSASFHRLKIFSDQNLIIVRNKQWSRAFSIGTGELTMEFTPSADLSETTSTGGTELERAFTPKTLMMPPVAANAWWTVERGMSPIIATAIHEGHSVRPNLQSLYALDDQQRLREEDPYTEFTIRDVPNRIVFHRSRFEVDINRSRDGAIYLTPEQAWGLDVWAKALPADQIETSLQTHDAYYAMLPAFLKDIERQFGRFVVLDIHSYNHRRDGPTASPAQSEQAPDINIGTSSMDRERWAPVVDALIAHFGSHMINGRPLDVRENVAFHGKGEQTRFIHTHFPDTGCAIAVEFKKFFMDEWTGDPDIAVLDQLRQMVATAVPILEKTLASQL
jgi:N-formylglutamate amidohydrolase